VDHSLIYTGAISLFEAIYFTLVTLTEKKSTAQVYALLIALTVVGFVGGILVYVMQKSVEDYVAGALIWESGVTQGSQDKKDELAEKDQSAAFVARMTEFVVIGISYVLGKLFYYSCYHWLSNRDAKSIGLGLKLELLVLAVAISVMALTVTVCVSGIFRRRLQNDREQLHEKISTLKANSAQSSVAKHQGAKLII
jgi:uncharacterized membrane-anchored protein